MDLREATELAIDAIGPAEINAADAGAFFLEGFLYAQDQAQKIAWEHARDIRINRHTGGTRFDQCADEIRAL